MAETEKRWLYAKQDFGTAPEIDAFLADVIAVCKKHGLSISHEDGHGAFLIETYDEELAGWLRAAADNRP